MPAEGLYTPITSFAVLLSIPGYADLVRACATTIPDRSLETLKPTAVQSECWGALLAPGVTAVPRDLIAISYTGSGKTLAFLVPILGELIAQRNAGGIA
jgi:superfamily II DNA/RNA helicase